MTRTTEVHIRCSELDAFKIAVAALREIAEMDDDSGNPDDWERCYGAGKDIAEQALKEMQA